jgi:phosphatidylserine decarboxylase
MKIAKGTKSWIYISLVSSLILFLLSFVFISYEFNIVLWFTGCILLLLAIFFIIFFRDPDKKIGKGIVACADGKIREIFELKDKDIGKAICISTFMNVYNVHVNRAPFNGVVKDIVHISGIHLPAFKKESEKNERVVILLDTTIGQIKIVQIAGTLARRIVPYINRLDKIKKGDRIGIIRLGSRVDLYLPKKAVKKICVGKGDKVISGEDSIAETND